MLVGSRVIAIRDCGPNDLRERNLDLGGDEQINNFNPSIMALLIHEPYSIKHVWNATCVSRACS